MPQRDKGKWWDYFEWVIINREVISNGKHGVVAHRPAHLGTLDEPREGEVFEVLWRRADGTYDPDDAVRMSWEQLKPIVTDKFIAIPNMQPSPAVQKMILPLQAKNWHASEKEYINLMEAARTEHQHLQEQIKQMDVAARGGGQAAKAKAAAAKANKKGKEAATAAAAGGKAAGKGNAAAAASGAAAAAPGKKAGSSKAAAAAAAGGAAATGRPAKTAAGAAAAAKPASKATAAPSASKKKPAAAAATAAGKAATPAKKKAAAAAAAAAADESDDGWDTDEEQQQQQKKQKQGRGRAPAAAAGKGGEGVPSSSGAEEFYSGDAGSSDDFEDLPPKKGKSARQQPGHRGQQQQQQKEAPSSSRKRKQAEEQQQQGEGDGEGQRRKKLAAEGPRTYIGHTGRVYPPELACRKKDLRFGTAAYSADAEGEFPVEAIMDEVFYTLPAKGKGRPEVVRMVLPKWQGYELDLDGWQDAADVAELDVYKEWKAGGKPAWFKAVKPAAASNSYINWASTR